MAVIQFMMKKLKAQVKLCFLSAFDVINNVISRRLHNTYILERGRFGKLFIARRDKPFGEKRLNFYKLD